ncbi:MAG: DUF433 domain-containing protein [Armatimonadota bacterium]
MKREELLQRITADPDVMVGKPIIRGTRITVEAILDELAGGVSEREVLEDFPELTPEDVRAAIAFAQDLVSEQRVYQVS